MRNQPLTLRRRKGAASATLLQGTACIMAAVPDLLKKQITDWTTEHILSCHLASDGLELRPHITLCYGLPEEEETREAVSSLLVRQGPLRARIIGLACFEGNTEGDVLHLVVRSPELQELHRVLSQSYPNKDRRRYVPHVTLAYLLPGASSIYLNEAPPFLGAHFVIDQMEWGDGNHQIDKIPLSFINWGFKTLSWQSELVGGALVSPPEQPKKKSQESLPQPPSLPAAKEEEVKVAKPSSPPLPEMKVVEMAKKKPTPKPVEETRTSKAEMAYEDEGGLPPSDPPVEPPTPPNPIPPPSNPPIDPDNGPGPDTESTSEYVSDEDRFINYIREVPDDPTPKLLYADWLEEQGRTEGYFIRVMTEASRDPNILQNINQLLPPTVDNRQSISQALQLVIPPVQRIDSLSPFQEQLMPYYVDLWTDIIISDQPVDRELAEESLYRVLDLLGMDRITGIEWGTIEEVAELEGREWEQTVNQIISQVRSRLWRFLHYYAEEEIRNQVSRRMRDLVLNQLENQDWYLIQREMPHRIWSPIARRVRDQVGSSYFSYLFDVGGLSRSELFDAYSNLLFNTGIWDIDNDGVAILTERINYDPNQQKGNLRGRIKALPEDQNQGLKQELPSQPEPTSTSKRELPKPPKIKERRNKASRQQPEVIDEPVTDASVRQQKTEETTDKFAEKKDVKKGIQDKPLVKEKLEKPKEEPQWGDRPPYGLEELETPSMRVLQHILDRGMDIDFSQSTNRDFREVPGLQSLPQDLQLPETEIERAYQSLRTSDIKKTTSKWRQSTTAKALYESPVEKKRPLPGGAMNQTTLLSLQNGMRAVYKPAKHEKGNAKFAHVPGTGYLREVATYQIANILDMSDLVPVTITRKAHMGVGSLQEFVPGQPAADSKSPYDGKKDASRAALLDYLLAQSDRNDGNWILQGNKIRLIDNGATLPPMYVKDSFVYLFLLQHVVEQGYDLPDEADNLMEKWPQVESVLRRNQIEENAIILTRQRFEDVSSGRYRTFAELPAFWANPNDYGYDDSVGEVMATWK